MKIMLEFMARYELDATEEGDLWEYLVIKLNNAGDQRDLKAWMKTWHDLIKTAKQCSDMISNGERNHPLSNIHVRVIRLVDVKTTAHQQLPHNPNLVQQQQFDDQFQEQQVDSPIRQQLPKGLAQQQQQHQLPTTSKNFLSQLESKVIKRKTGPNDVNLHEPVEKRKMYKKSKYSQVGFAKPSGFISIKEVSIIFEWSKS
ncbi:uncharacterized protein LOC116416294 [Nasonia vitripennis]|uniref:Uncharacterized protein n=1 Tax=Nasonia vitripennis TaxID=7425 RepID=A0A7M7R0K7_NASVI|nr:uncharacterized protein LOC116416294 [Nasonia vitripennis]XP_032457389.1 uncharacterized protein LOC116416294 [Nasonia vitripennis]